MELVDHPAVGIDLDPSHATYGELEYEEATAAEVRPDLARAKALLARDFAVA